MRDRDYSVVQFVVKHFTFGKSCCMLFDYLFSYCLALQIFLMDGGKVFKFFYRFICSSVFSVMVDKAENRFSNFFMCNFWIFRIFETPTDFPKKLIYVSPKYRKIANRNPQSKAIIKSPKKTFIKNRNPKFCVFSTLSTSDFDYVCSINYTEKF